MFEQRANVAIGERSSDLLEESVETDVFPWSDDLIWDLTVEAASETGAESHGLPIGLDDWVPSPFLAAVLSVMDPFRLSEFDRVVYLKALDRMRSHYGARAYEAMVSLEDAIAADDTDAEFIFAVASSEIRAALKLTPRSADRELGLAQAMFDHYPTVWEAYARGLFDYRRAATFVRETAHLSDDARDLVCDQLVNEASELTSGQLVARIRKLALEAEPEEAQARYEAGLEGRRVYGQANDDGTGNIHGWQLAPNRVSAAMKRDQGVLNPLCEVSERRA